MSYAILTNISMRQREDEFSRLHHMPSFEHTVINCFSNLGYLDCFRFFPILPGRGLRLGAAGPGLEAALPIPAPEASVLP